MPEPSRRRTAVKVLSIIDERGPNEKPVGYDDEGNKVEWNVPDADEDADDAFWPMILLRNEDDLFEAIDELTDKVWYGRHGLREQHVEAGKMDIRPDIWVGAKAAAAEMEKQYGKEKLSWNDSEWGMLSGKLSALRWATGSEWDFLDTWAYGVS